MRLSTLAVRHRPIFILVVLIAARQVFPAVSQRARSTAVSPQDAFSSLQGFIENRGQTKRDVAYYLRGRGRSVWLTQKGVLFDLPRTSAGGNRIVVAQEFAGASASLHIRGHKQVPGHRNFFRGNDAANWVTSAPAFEEVAYEGVYPGIDFWIRVADAGCEQEFLIKPGAEPGHIKVRFRGIERLTLSPSGSLEIVTAAGVLRESPPRVYQESSSGPRRIPARFVLLGSHTYTFALTEYDPALPLVIDPTLDFSTFLGESGADYAGAIATDASGSVYVAGTTESLDFPITPGAVQSKIGRWTDAFVAKLDPKGSRLVYCTFLGGNHYDQALALAVDPSGHAYVGGETESSDFPTTPGSYVTSSWQSSRGFLSKIDPESGKLLYSAVFYAQASAVGVDSSGAAFVLGYGTPPGEPGGLLLLKISPDGSRLAYSRVLSASYQIPTTSFFRPRGLAITVDPEGNPIIAGTTDATDTPGTPQAFQKSPAGDLDCFVTKRSTADGSTIYLTYLGGKQADECNAIATDSTGNVYVAGITQSLAFPTTSGVVQRVYAGGIGGLPCGDGFVTEFSSDGSSLLFSTYLGGTSCDGATGVAPDPSGGAFVSGFTASTNFPLSSDVGQPSILGRYDGFLTRLNTRGNMLYSTYLGGRGDDVAGGGGFYWGEFLTVDASNRVCLAGTTLSADFPITKGSYQSTMVSAPDVFVLCASFETPAASPPRFGAGGVVNAASFQSGPVSPGEIVTIFGSDLGPGTLTRLTLSSDGTVGKALAGTRVLFDGVAAPLIYVSATQSSAVVPYSVAGRPTTRVQVEYRGVSSEPVTVPVVSTCPALFSLDSSGRGQGAILLQDYSVNAPSNPARRGSVVMLYATGEGETDPAGVDGKLAAAPLPVPKSPASVRIGGIEAKVLYAGGAPGLVAGVFQVNVLVPDAAPVGSAVEIELSIGNRSSPRGVTLAIQ